MKTKQRFTVMLIPHSEKKIYNFQISLFTLLFSTTTLCMILAAFSLLIAHFQHTNEQYVRLNREREASEKTLTSLKDEIASIRPAVTRFKTSMEKVLSTVENLDANPATRVSLVAASFPSFPDGMRSGADGTWELSDLKTLTNLMGNSSGLLDKETKLLTAFRDLMANTPTTWPLKGAWGIITTRFGWTTNPFTKVGYMHTGVDIAAGLGTPIVATADGTITQVSYQEDLGNFVTIQHKYGLSTRYSHMSKFANKRKGDRVDRGEVIGYVGSTGLSTGPHLDYVVRLGSSYVNPMQFLSLRPENASALAADRKGRD